MRRSAFVRPLPSPLTRPRFSPRLSTALPCCSSPLSSLLLSPATRSLSGHAHTHAPSTRSLSGHAHTRSLSSRAPNHALRPCIHPLAPSTRSLSGHAHPRSALQSCTQPCSPALHPRSCASGEVARAAPHHSPHTRPALVCRRRPRPPPSVLTAGATIGACAVPREARGATRGPGPHAARRLTTSPRARRAWPWRHPSRLDCATVSEAAMAKYMCWM